MSLNLFSTVFLVVFALILLNHAVNGEDTDVCDKSTSQNQGYQRYFEGMKYIYKTTGVEGTCLPVHEECGWPKRKASSKLPLLVFSVGLEGAGHHLWTELLNKPVFDCVWINGRYYFRELSDGVPRTTLSSAYAGFKESFQLRAATGAAPCTTIYDAEDSFPTGAIRRSGRVFMRPDLVHLQNLDGVLYDIKFLLILRNTTDTAISALRRNFFSHVAQELRTVEHTLTYIEAALRKVPCHRIFIAHYEHILADPRAFLEPLSQFLELSDGAKGLLKQRLAKPNSRLPSRKEHKLDQFQECKDAGKQGKECYDLIHDLVNEFLLHRNFMWPTFAANGFDVAPVLNVKG